MTFFHQSLLWLLAIPALLLAVDLQRRLRAARRTARAAAQSKILTATIGSRTATLPPPTTNNQQPTTIRIRWRLALGLALAITALARPQWGRIEQPVFEQAREILIAVDLSRSMMAADVSPTRLDRARLLIQSLLGQLAGERIGLLVFAGTAFLQSPLSSDYEILREFLPELGPDYLPQGGTNYSSLLSTALDSFSTGDADRFLVILSDGEADPADPWRAQAEACQKRGIHAIGLGIGTEAGAMIPDGNDGYVKDERGAVVLSRLESATLRELADKTSGVYTDASQWVDLNALIKATVERGRKGDFQESSRTRLIERYQWALGPALFFLLWSLWREFPVHPRTRRIRLATAAAAILLTFFAAALPSPAAGADAPASSLLTPPDPDDPHAPPATVDSAATSAALSKLVARLSGQSALTARDAAALAEATLAYGQPLQAQGKPVPGGPVDDALQAVDQAEKKFPAAADWTRLRSALQQLKQKQQPPPQQDQQQQQQQDKQQDKQQQNQQNQNGQSGRQSNDQQQQQSGDPQSPPSSQEPPKPDEAHPDNQQPSDPSQQPDQQQQQAPKPPAQSAFDDKPGEDRQPDQPPPASETQRVGGAATGTSPIDKNTDPNLIVPLQRLEHLKDNDSPAQLFQLMQDQPPQPGKNRRNW